MSSSSSSSPIRAGPRHCRFSSIDCSCSSSCRAASLLPERARILQAIEHALEIPLAQRARIAIERTRELLRIFAHLLGERLQELVHRRAQLIHQLLESSSVAPRSSAWRSASCAWRSSAAQPMKNSRSDGSAARGDGQALQALAEEMRKIHSSLRVRWIAIAHAKPERSKSMLDRLENLARSGNKDAARRLLEQLQSMLENLQMARPGANGEDAGR